MTTSQGRLSGSSVVSSLKACPVPCGLPFSFVNSTAPTWTMKKALRDLAKVAVLAARANRYANLLHFLRTF